jgi:hypothetical protein
MVTFDVEAFSIGCPLGFYYAQSAQVRMKIHCLKGLKEDHSEPNGSED